MFFVSCPRLEATDGKLIFENDAIRNRFSNDFDKNQSIEVRLRAWTKPDYGEKSQKHVKAGWIFASEVSFKSKFLKCGS